MVKHRLLQVSLPLLPLLLATPTAHGQTVAGPPHTITATDTTSRTSVDIARDTGRITYALAVPVRNFEVWVSNWDGSNNHRVTWDHDNVQNGNPSISSDGAGVFMFAQTAMGNKQHRIWKVDLATSAGTQMTQPGDPSPGKEHDVYPDVSPDGTRLLFDNRRRNGTNSTWQLFWMRNEVESATNVPVQITNVPGAQPFSGDALNARWTADSRYILLERNASNGSIYLADPTDANGDGLADNAPVNLLPNKPSNARASFATQATVGGKVYFLYTDTPGGRAHVFSGDLMDVETGFPRLENIHQVVGSDGIEAAPTSSGGRLAWVAVDDTAPTKTYTVMGAELSNDSTPGTVSGRVVLTGGTTADQVLVRFLDGNQDVVVTQPDSNGAFSASLAPGGYTLRIETPSGATNKGITVYPGSSLSLSGEAAPRPQGVLPTIQPNGSVSVRLQPVAPRPLSGYSLVGIHIYRSNSEAGPWTRMTATALTPAETMEFVDAGPPDLTHAFYTASAITTNGAQTVESDYAVPAQAANNLAFNPSFEQVENGLPTGWQSANAGANRSQGGVDSGEHVSGSQAAFIQGVDTRLDSHILQAQPYWIPVATGEKYVSAMYAKFVNAPLSGYASTRHAIADTDPHRGRVTSGFMDESHNTNQLPDSVEDPSTPWTWLSNTTGFGFPDGAKYTRMSAYWTTANAATGGERAWFDDVRFQVRRVGATGILSGRVVDAAGNPVMGAVATTSTGQTGVSSWPYGQFVIRDVPTGMVNVTVTAAPATPAVIQGIRNIGGYQFPADVVLDKVIPVTLSGTVFLPDGGPAPGAEVRIMQLSADLFTETYTSATTDAGGRYHAAAPAAAQPGDSFWVVAVKAGYQGAFTPALTTIQPMLSQPGTAFGAVGDAVVDLTLGRATPVIQVARADAPPTIDGNVTTAEWQKSQQITGFFQHLSPDTPFTPGSKAYALWDNTNLYVAFVADEPNPAGIVDTATGPDNLDLFANDHVSVYLDPTRSAAFGHGHEAWQIAANLNPSIASADGLLETRPMLLDLSISAYMDSVSGLQVATRRSDADQKWSMEFKIPFAGLSSPANTGLTVTPPAVGDEWRGLIARFRPQGVDASAQNASTTFTTKAFAQAHQWNTIRFVNTAAPLRGDLNNDGSVTLADAGIALRIAGGFESLGSRASVGDVFGADNAVSLADALRIAGYATGANPAAL